MADAVRSVGLRITAIAAALVVVVSLVAVAFVVEQSRPRELLERPKPGQHKIYVDANEMLLGIALVGLMAIVLAGFASVLVARRAVRPLGRALALQRAFVADASHELRTPLAVLDARVQLLQRRVPPGDALRPGLDDLRADARVLGEVVTDLLDAAGAVQTPGEQPAEVDAVTAETVDALRIVAAERGVRLDTSLLARAAVTMPAATLRRVVTALVDNAVAHSPENGVVHVGTERRATTVRLTVTDHGPGIVGIEPDRVFDRFARAAAPTAAQAAPAPGRRGFGLGLALVRDAATRFGGGVAVQATSPAGTVLAVDLPLAAAGRRQR